MSLGKLDKTSDFVEEKKIRMWVKEISVFRILFNNDTQQISFNSGKKWPRKWYRNMTFSLKKCIMKKTHLKCKHHNRMPKTVAETDLGRNVPLPCIYCIMDSF